MSTIGFGKYKGQPISVLLNDKPYLKWCQEQPWFQEKYSSLCSKPELVSKKTMTKDDKIKKLLDDNKRLQRNIEDNKKEIFRLQSCKDPEINEDSEEEEEDTKDEDAPPPKINGKRSCLL